MVSASSKRFNVRRYIRLIPEIKTDKFEKRIKILGKAIKKGTIKQDGIEILDFDKLNIQTFNFTGTFTKHSKMGYKVFNLRINDMKIFQSGHLTCSDILVGGKSIINKENGNFVMKW